MVNFLVFRALHDFSVHTQCSPCLVSFTGAGYRLTLFVDGPGCIDAVRGALGVPSVFVQPYKVGIVNFDFLTIVQIDDFHGFFLLSVFCDISALSRCCRRSFCNVCFERSVVCLTVGLATETVLIGGFACMVAASTPSTMLKVFLWLISHCVILPAGGLRDRGRGPFLL